MTSKFFVGALVGALVSCCLIVEHARAATAYTYTGNTFTAFGILDLTPPAGTYTTSMSLTGTFTLQNPLLPNLPLPGTDITADVLSFSFSDGRNTITKTNATFFSFIVTTDALANINLWAVFLRLDDPTFGTVVGSQRREIISNSSSDTGQIFEVINVAQGLSQIDRGLIERTPGTWSSAPVVPLPAALPLFVTGLGALGLLGWRRKRKALAA
jgi:hypothetical protein